MVYKVFFCSKIPDIPEENKCQRHCKALCFISERSKKSVETYMSLRYKPSNCIREI